MNPLRAARQPQHDGGGDHRPAGNAALPSSLLGGEQSHGQHHHQTADQPYPKTKSNSSHPGILPPTVKRTYGLSTNGGRVNITRQMTPTIAHHANMDLIRDGYPGRWTEIRKDAPPPPPPLWIRVLDILGF
jgi:hypothetical protein